MTHIGYALLKDGQPTGQLRALCGAQTTSVLTSGAQTTADVCPVCKRLDEQGA